MSKIFTIIKFCIYLVILENSLAKDSPGSFSYIPNNITGAFLGQVTFNCSYINESNWIAVFDEDGNIAGANKLIVEEKKCFYQHFIYGDDPISMDMDIGMDVGEDYYLKLYNFSDDVILDYPDATNDYDVEFDMYAPPAPPPPYICCALIIINNRIKYI